MPDTTLTKTHAVKLSGSEFQQLVLMIDDMSRLHVPGIEELCKAATDGTLSVLTTMVKLDGQISEAGSRASPARRRPAIESAVRVGPPPASDLPTAAPPCGSMSVPTAVITVEVRPCEMPTRT